MSLPGGIALSTASYLARAAIAVVLLTPITLLMGGTLTLLIRHLVRHDLEVGGWRIALLYAVNTAGAALGCSLTDFVLVPLSACSAPRWSPWPSTSSRASARWCWRIIPGSVARRTVVPGATAKRCGAP